MRALSVFLLLLLSFAARAAAEPVLYLDDRKLMGQLEERGYGFEGLFGGDQPTLDRLYEQSPAYRAVVDRIAVDVSALRAEMKAHGRPLYEVTDGNVGRVIDMRWLKSEASRFRLVGVVNRVDRRDFLSLRGVEGCGEVRLIYRLAYSFRKNGRGRVLASRLPVNFNAVYDVAPDADGGCMGATGRWRPALDEAVDAGWLAGGVLDPSELTLRQIEFNAQIVRFPSGQETEFGGQAAYLMRIFRITADGAEDVPLENTVDTERVAGDAALRSDLVNYVRDNLAAIDQGVYEMPDRFLATKVVSYSTFGSARETNRPFTRLLTDADFDDLDYQANRLVRSPAGLIDRLDNGSCQGCHQSGSTAGFHFIGLDDGDVSPLNRIKVGISPHLHAELPRRAAYIAAVVEDREPDRFRPLSIAPPATWQDGEAPAYTAADAAMPCLTEREAARFGQNWSCGSGLVCTQIAGSRGDRHALAQCLLPKDTQSMFSGHPCVSGEITNNAAEPYNDRMTIKGQFAAFAPAISRDDYTCRPPRIGVPGGIAYRACNEKDRSFAGFKAGKPIPREICGLAGGKAFDYCVATNNFDQCLGGAVVRGNRPSCSAERFCREDYMCQDFPPDTPGLGKVEGIGFCSPTYFVFQMRIDNHTTPWASATATSAPGIAEEFGDTP